MTYFLQGELSQEERNPTTSRFRVIPVPLERTVSYGGGTSAGPDAILEASTELERLCRDTEPCACGITTEPAVECFASLPTVMEDIAKRTCAAVAAGAIPVVLGGEHALTYGAVRGVARATGRPIGIIQIDAHADLRKAYQEERHSHASVMQLLVEEEDVALAQFGVRALCREEVDRRVAHSVFHIDAEELVRDDIHTVQLPEEFPNDIYVSFDLDGLDPAILPATGTPVPGGLGYYQALNLVRASLIDRKLVGIDVVELAPEIGSRVSNFTAAQLTYALMAAALPTLRDQTL
ncbi:agmatinase [Epibacterium ulvae]|uniref:Agmatinase n=1 Tax=Epibacterium ulvae TaxID=1156985 RepID=A0A1G5QSU2_9RHOB|nr:agmatinase [Epibacterium ulvae]SCZ64746.1 agmatinase [Epibacterium ulvae]